MDARTRCTHKTVAGIGGVHCPCCNDTIGRKAWRRKLRADLRGVARTRFNRETDRDLRNNPSD